MASSLFSVAALCVTIMLHCCIGLRPDLNIAINGFLSLLWVVSWSLLTWYMSPTLQNMCDVQHWHEDTGIMVCRIYKALFTFAFFGTYVLTPSYPVRPRSILLTPNHSISTLAALCLDFYVRRQNTRRGIYKLHDIDTKRSEATRGPFTDEEMQPRESEAWEAPRPSMGPYAEQSSDKRMQQQGYAVPEGQFGYGYGDTAYYGGHHEKP